MVDNEELTDPFHIELEKAGHKLVRESDGSVNEWIMDYGYHNGPGCQLCYESWCQHCARTPDSCDGC